MLSFCIIGKNEEWILDKCLSALSRYGREIVFVDTGSTDRTRDIALKYTDKVFDFQWIDDFSAARNFSAEMASNENILAIDCDEVITDFDIERTEALIEENPEKIGRFLLINDLTRDGEAYSVNERVSRLYSKRTYHYVGAIHEQIRRIDGEMPDYYNIPLTMAHYGYEGDLKVRRKKTERNRNLLLKELEKTPEDPYLLYQLGATWYMEKDYANAVDYFGRALEHDVDPRLEYVQDLVEAYGYSLVNTGRCEEALGLEGVYDEFAVSADFVFLMGLIYMRNGLPDEAFAQFKKATGMKLVKVQGTDSFRAYYNMGVICECTGRKKEAEKYYKLAGDYKPALEGLKRL